jgi:prophage antirepressor-like protein
MNELQIFNNPEFGEIRTLEENGTVLFCGSDVAKALGYARPNEAVAKHCKGTLKRRTPTASGKQKMLFIPEADLYRLAFRSKVPSAEKFTDWVVEEVLPTIRKQGAYLPPAAADKLAEGFQALADQVTALSNRVAELEQGKPRSGRFFLPEGGEEEAQYIPGPAARRRWMRTMSEKLDLLSNKYDAPHNELLHDIYMALEKRYGVVLNEERLKTMEDLELTDCSMLSAIFYNPELREGIQRSIDHNLAPENRGW